MAGGLVDGFGPPTAKMPSSVLTPIFPFLPLQPLRLLACALSGARVEQTATLTWGGFSRPAASREAHPSPSSHNYSALVGKHPDPPRKLLTWQLWGPRQVIKGTRSFRLQEYPC